MTSERPGPLADASRRLRQKLPPPPGRAWYELRFTVFQRDGFACRYCGATAASGVQLHADHVIPRSAGGPDTLDNLVTACAGCNFGKGARLLEQSAPRAETVQEARRRAYEERVAACHLALGWGQTRSFTAEQFRARVTAGLLHAGVPEARLPLYFESGRPWWDLVCEEIR